MRSSISSGLALVAALLACEGVQLRADSGVVTSLGVPGRANAHPSIAARGELVAVAWSVGAAGGGSDVYVAMSRDAGTSFGAPVQVNAEAGEARNGGEMPARVVIAPPRASAIEPEIVVVWRSRVTSTSIRAARSRDGGRRFEPAFTVQSATAVGERGWQTAAVDTDGRVHAIWLDHRAMAADGGGAHAAHRKAANEAGFDGAAMAQRSSLYYASLDQGGAVEREITKGVCYCCKTALATGPRGAVYAAWRQVYDGNIRDIAFTASQDGGRTFAAPTRVSEDRWQIIGCPDDGPAMAVDTAGLVHVVWPTVIGGDTPEGALFYASTRDGLSFAPRTRVPTLGSPKPSHPQVVAAPDGRVIVAWDEARDGKRTAAMSTMTVSEGRATFSPATTLGVGATPAVYPMLAATTRGIVAVWTASAGETSTIGVRRLDLSPRSGSR